jgi:hypothetical protein
LNPIFGPLRSLVFATLLAAAAPAMACNFWQVVTFSDGVKGCLTDYALSKAPALVGTIAESVPKVGSYVVAMPVKGASCPAVSGMASYSLANGEAIKNMPPLAERTKLAVRQCDAAVRGAKGDMTQCECQAVVADGTSPLRERDFATLSSGGSIDTRVLTATRTVDESKLTCNFWQVVTFSDGVKGCLTDYAVSKAPALVGTIAESVPKGGAYVVAMPVKGAFCPAVSGMTAYSSVSGQGKENMPPLAERTKLAVRQCDAAVRDAKGDMTQCECQAVVADGTSPLRERDFATLSSGGSIDATVLTATRTADESKLTCSFWQVVTFSDGAKGCLTDYGVSKVSGVAGNIGDSIPKSGGFVVAMPLNAASCPAVAGMVAHPALSITGPWSPTISVRVKDAIGRCEAAVRDANGNPSQCSCEAVVVDGLSPLSKGAFETLASRGTANVAIGASKPIAEQRRPTPVVPAAPQVTKEPLKRVGEPLIAVTATRPTSDRPVVSSPVANTSVAVARMDAPEIPNDAATARLQTELAELRVRLDAIMKRQESAVAAQATGSLPKAPHLTSRALVIGNSGYVSFPGLPNPRNDARSIAAKLRSFNIDVDLVVDADRDTLIKALNDYSARAGSTDVNILFYAGHGVQVDGVNYLVPTNMRADGTSAGYIKLAGIALNAALEYLPAKTRLVFLDACRDNPVSRGLMATRGAGAIGLAPVAAPGGTLIAYSTKDGATAEDGVGANSPYTAALLQHLDAAQDISLVLRQVRQTVMRSTSNRQEPWEYGSLVGEQLVLSQMSKN